MARHKEKASTSHSAASTTTVGDALAANQHLLRLLEERTRDQQNWQAERDRWAEERLLLRAMIDQVPDYLFVKDTHCRFLIANVAVASDLGSSPDGILGKTDLELHPPELAQRFFADDQQVMRTGVAMLDHEEYVILPTGERRWLSTSKVPLRSAAGAITGLVGVARDITRRKEAEEQIRHLAYHDQLTGLANRAEFEGRLGRAVAERDPSFLLLIDLDRFKQVNDTLGHAAGDELLRMVADRVVALIGPAGFVARLGGDEFAVVTGRDPSTICSAIISSLSAPYPLDGKVGHVGASVGATRIRPGLGAMEALRQADIALYEAKSRGRGLWRLFEDEMASAVEIRRQLEDDLRAALSDEGQIFPMYQPIFTADRRRLVGVEALARWQHPVAGIISPSEFIPIAEETGLIGALGESVLRNACGLLARCEIPWVAVNVSTVQLDDCDFAQRTLSTIAAAGVEPSRVHLELTESVLLGESGQARGILDELRKAGVQIALDDFGIGYSSLRYLRHFAIDHLKIDRSFVAEIGSPGANAIIEAVIALANGLGMTTTAEGVETEAQRSFLVHAGCQYVQGFLISPPATVDELLATAAGFQ